MSTRSVRPQRLAAVLAALALALLLSLPAAARQSAPAEPVLTAEGISEYALDNGMRVAREEIFGPVATVIPFATEEEAVTLANDSVYGLSGSLWTRDVGREIRVAKAVRTGVLSVNSNSSVHQEAPFGGYRQSGLGRESGLAAMAAYTETKTVYLSEE